MWRPDRELVLAFNVAGATIGGTLSALCLGAALAPVAVAGMAIAAGVFTVVGIGLIIWDVVARREIPERQPLLVKPAEPEDPIGLEPPADM